MIKNTISTLILAGAVFASPLAALAQQDDHHDARHDDYRGSQHDDHRDNQHDDFHPHPYVRHNEWRRGYHMDHDRWEHAQRVDYRRYHLSRPPRGYEWREADGNFVLGAVATGVIASVVAANAAR